MHTYVSSVWYISTYIVNIIENWKDNPEKVVTLSTQETGGRQTKQIIQNRKITKMSNTDPTNNQGWTQFLMKVKQFLLLIRHLLCCSYIQSSLINVLEVMKERNKSMYKVKDPFSFRMCIFRNGQPDRDDNRSIFVVWFIFQSDTASE